PRLLVDDHLVSVAEHVLHGLDEHALAGDIGRKLVLIIDLEEAISLALRFGDDLATVALRCLEDALGVALGLLNHPVGVGSGFVLEPLLIGTRSLYVAEGVDDLLRWVDLLLLHFPGQNTRTVGVQRLLPQPPPRGFRLCARPAPDPPAVAFGRRRRPRAPL